MIGVFARATLPRASRIAELHLDVGRQGEALVMRHLETPIPGQRSVELPGQFASLPDEGVDHRP